MEPFGSSCQFESAWNEAFSLSIEEEGEMQTEGEGRDGGGVGLEVMVWEEGALCKQRKV